MKLNSHFLLTKFYIILSLLDATLLAFTKATPALASTTVETSYRIVVNSNQDGLVQPDSELTLREAIELANGTLPLEKLSEAEQSQVESITEASRIEFNLPPDQTTIRLVELLPPLDSPGLIVDGTTQPGYDPSQSATAEIAIPIPVVTITPAEQTEVFRGLTITADGVEVRGLSLYGFSGRYRNTVAALPADILIAHRLTPPNTSQESPPAASFPFYDRDVPPKDVVIEDNWLGIRPDGTMPATTSAFGVSVFNSLGTTIRRNRIAGHDGSGIITSVRAENLQVTQNIIVGNGIAGMPDAIRLEGVIDNSEITSNLICGNDGSAVFLFKPDGATQIRDNQIKFNGRRLGRAAVYLMGDNHQVINNQITHQTGPGIVVTSYPKSDRNIIQDNRFAALEGLSIDLNAQQNVGVQDFQRGDGPNPPRNSPNRRKETGNSAINAPEFLATEFFRVGNTVNIDGIADPGSSVQLYQVTENTTLFGPLSEPLATVEADEQGRFGFTLSNLQPGDRVSAIATHPQYGTSEPALNASVQSLDNPVSLDLSQPKVEIPQCTTPPTPVAQQPPQQLEPEPAPEPIRLRVPTNVHFALDSDVISPESTAVLDQIITALRDYPFIMVELQGHTDPRASDAYNFDLADRRAKSVRNYLLQQGIAPERLTIRSLGETQPKVPGTNPVDHARNRRVDFVFKDARGIDIIFEEQEGDLQPETP